MTFNINYPLFQKLLKLLCMMPKTNRKNNNTDKTIPDKENIDA